MEDLKKGQDLKSLAKFAEEAVAKIKAELKNRIGEESRSAMRLSAVFAFDREIERSKREEMINTLIARYRLELDEKNDAMIKADFKSLERFQKQFHATRKKHKKAEKAQRTPKSESQKECSKKTYSEKELFQEALERKVALIPHFAKSAIEIRAKVKAISEANAEPERFFSLMNRLKSKLKNRLTAENIERRMTVWTHTARDKVKKKKTCVKTKKHC